MNLRLRDAQFSGQAAFAEFSVGHTVGYAAEDALMEDAESDRLSAQELCQLGIGYPNFVKTWAKLPI